MKNDNNGKTSLLKSNDNSGDQDQDGDDAKLADNDYDYIEIDGNNLEKCLKNIMAKQKTNGNELTK